MMVNSCCVPGCTNRQSKEKGISLHRFPAHPAWRRDAWTRAVDRSPVDLHSGSGLVSQKPWTPTDGSRICGVHFTEGKPSDVPSHPDYTPSLNLKRLQRSKRKRKEPCQHCMKPKAESSSSKKQKSETIRVKEEKKETQQKLETIRVKEQKKETQQKLETIRVKEEKKETQQKLETTRVKEQKKETQQKSETTRVKEEKKETQQKSETICVKEQKKETQQKLETIRVKEEKKETQQKSETICVKEQKKETQQKSETICVKEQEKETQQKSETISVKEEKSESSISKEQQAEMSSVKEEQAEMSGAMDDAATALLELSEQSHSNKCSTGSQTDPLPESEARRAMMSYQHMDNKTLSLFTGLSRTKFLWLFDKLHPYISEKQISRDITMYDHLLLMLAKMRDRLQDLDIAFRFQISETDSSQIWSTWLPILSRCLRDLIIWPEQEIARSSIPSAFKPEYRNCVSIIENFEVDYQPCLSEDVFYSDEAWLARPRPVTKKYLISITPFGAISFISKGFDVGISEKEMALASGYMDKLRPGDEVIADNRFTVAEEVSAKGACLRTAFFAIGEYQQAEVDATERVRCLRNEVVDTVCGKLLKKFCILESQAVGDIGLLDDVVALACALYNLKPCVIKFKSKK